MRNSPILKEQLKRIKDIKSKSNLNYINKIENSLSHKSRIYGFSSSNLQCYNTEATNTLVFNKVMQEDLGSYMRPQNYHWTIDALNENEVMSTIQFRERVKKDKELNIKMIENVNKKFNKKI